MKMLCEFELGCEMKRAEFGAGWGGRARGNCGEERPEKINARGRTLWRLIFDW
jgi:hypothetical protein